MADNTEPLAFGPDDEALQAELTKYKKALEEEFARSTDGSSLDSAVENVERYTRDFFKKHMATAAAQVVWLSGNSTSDSVRLNASKYIIGEALADAKEQGDPIRELMQELIGT